MASRGSVGFDSRKTAAAAALTTSRTFMPGSQAKTRKMDQAAASRAPASLAAPSGAAFDVLLVVVSVVSTLLVVTLALLMMVLRLLRRVAAAHRVHARLYSEDYDDEQQDVSGTADETQETRDTVSEQQPLLQRPAQTGVGQQQQPRRRTPSSIGLIDALCVVLGASSTANYEGQALGEEGSHYRQQRRQHVARSHRSRSHEHHEQEHRATKAQSQSLCIANEVGVLPSSAVAATGTAALNVRCSDVDETKNENRDVAVICSPAPPAQDGRTDKQRDGKSLGAAVSDGEAALPFRATTRKDVVVFNTTHDSRYRLLQRIGIGAFSSVYLVQHKTTGHKYALKYIMCKNDRERLTALRECEVIHCLQGHPQVIRIVDMFMSYQFQRGDGGVKSTALAASAPFTRNSAGSITTAASPPPPPPPSGSARQYQQWQVTSTGNMNCTTVSPHVARSLVQSPSLWARPMAAPTPPFPPLESSPTSLSLQPQQQQPLSLFVNKAGFKTPEVVMSVNTKQTATAVTPYGPSQAPNPLPAPLARSAVSTPAFPSSPLCSPTSAVPATSTTTTTKWVEVQLQGLSDHLMAKVATSGKLADAEVTAALRARIRDVGFGSFLDEEDNEEENKRSREDHNADQFSEIVEVKDSGKHAVQDGDRNTDCSHADPHNAPLILSAADTERLLMDARLLQQRHRRQRPPNRRSKYQKKQTATETSTVTTATTGGSLVARGGSAVALNDFGETQSISLCSLHQQVLQKQQESVQYTSRTSSASDALIRPCESPLYGKPCALPSPTKSSCSNTRSGLMMAISPPQRQPSPPPIRHSNSSTSNVPSGGAAGAAVPTTDATVTSSNCSEVGNARSSPSFTETRASRQPQQLCRMKDGDEREQKRYDAPLKENPGNGSTVSNDVNTTTNATKKGSDCSVALTSSPAHPRSAGSKESRYSSSSGSLEEPIQPIRRVLVPPPSYMHPPPGLAVLQESRINAQENNGDVVTSSYQQQQQLSSPPSCVSRNRHACFSTNVSGAQEGAASVTGGEATTITTATPPSPKRASQPSSLEVRHVAVNAVKSDDVNALPPAAAAAVQKGPKEQFLDVPPNQQQQQEAPVPAATYAPASWSSTRLVNNYAPVWTSAGAPLPATLTNNNEAQPAPITVASKDYPQPNPSAVIAPDAGRETPESSSTTTIEEIPSSGQKSNLATAVVNTNRSGTGSNNTYAPVCDGRAGYYNNPYREGVRGGEVVPPPRTSYAPGGGARHNSLVAPSPMVTAPQQQQQLTPLTSDTRNRPTLRAWKDNSALAQTAATAASMSQTLASSSELTHTAAPTFDVQQHQQQLSSPSPAVQLPLITRSTYAPLRYGNLIQPATTMTTVTTAIFAERESAVRPLVVPAAHAISPATYSSATDPSKPTSGRLSVSAAIRSARAGQRGERMHFNDGKPHVHVPMPTPEGNLVPPRPFTNSNELNNTHAVRGRYKNEHDDQNFESADGEAKNQNNITNSFASPNVNSNNSSNKNRETAAYGDAPSPKKALYTNLGVTLTTFAPPLNHSLAHHPNSSSNANTAAATVTSHLFRDATSAAAVPYYGATNATDNNATYSAYAPRGQTYAPAVRYANAGNPALWRTYGQWGRAAIGPASVAAARASAEVLKEAQGDTVKTDANGKTSISNGNGEVKGHRKDGDSDEDKSSSAAGTASTTQSNSSGSLTHDIRDTGYLCLVMEYHPMGDLCHYVLRAKQQLTLQRQEQQHQSYSLLQNSVNHNPFDAHVTTSPNSPTPPDNCSSTYAAAAAAGAGTNYSNINAASSLTGRHSHVDPNSPTAQLDSSTASWIAAAAAATWRIKPAVSRSDPNLTVGAPAAGGNGNNSGSGRPGGMKQKESDEGADPTSRNPLTEPQLLSIAYQLSSVLDYMHHQSPPIIHRDLKPENILIKGELTEFLEDVPVDFVMSISGVGGGDGNATSRYAKKPVSLLTTGGAAAATSAGMHNNMTNNNTGGRGSYAERASATSQLPSIPSNRGITTATGTAVGTTPRLSLAAPPPIRIKRAVIPIVVTDFGLAMLHETQGGHCSGSRGGGTRPYIAPECWHGATCTASDMWSLGCVLYALATTRLTARTVRLMSEEAKRDGFASRMLNDIISQNYSLAFASFVVSLLVVDPAKRPTAAQASQCFLVTENEVRFDAASPFFSNVLDL